MSNMFSVINELRIERDRIEQVLEHLRRIHEIMQIILLSYAQYYNKLGNDTRIDLVK